MRMRTLAALALLALLPVAQAVRAQDKPNVLFIAIDDLNDWVGALGGNPQTKTPNIDALAERGMLFTNAQTVATSCMPSRTALLTGVSPFTDGIYDQRNDWRKEPRLDGLPTLPRYFRTSGYHTVGAGKIFHAHTYFPAGFSGQQDVTAWDRFYPSLQRQLPDEVRPPGPPQNGNPDLRGRGDGFVGFDWGKVVTEDYAMGDGQDADFIASQLTQPADGPRFTAIGIYRPHLPWYVPQKYFDMHPLESIKLPPYMANDLDDVPASAPNNMKALQTHDWVVKNKLWRPAIQGYLASISFADAMVGRVIDALDRSGQADNTIIVLWSDHGWHLGEKNHWRKMTLWERSTHVPLIVVAPGVTKAGSRSDKPVSLLDIYPTLTELAGLKTPDHVEGDSLVPLLKDPNADWDHVALTVYGYGNYSVRDTRYRYTVYHDGAEELYDQQTDPNEWTNVAKDPRYAQIKARLAAEIPAHPASPSQSDADRPGG